MLTELNQYLIAGPSRPHNNTTLGLGLVLPPSSTPTPVLRYCQLDKANFFHHSTFLPAIPAVFTSLEIVLHRQCWAKCHYFKKSLLSQVVSHSFFCVKTTL